jgi:hypothetical protein
MTQTFAFDLYLSYSPQETRWAQEWLLPRLERAGLRVFVDFRDAHPGASKIAEIERAVLESSKTLIVLTPAYLKSEWNDFQSILIQHLDPAARQQRLIPLIYSDTELPLRLNMLVPVDFTDAAQRDAQLHRLLGAFNVKWVEEAVEKVGKVGKVEEETRGKGEEETRVRKPQLQMNDPVLAAGLHDLKSYLTKGRLVLFIGADLPEELTGAPDRQTLANRLAEEKGLPLHFARGQGTGGWSLSAVAQQVMASGNRYEFTQFLKRQLSAVKAGPFYQVLGGFIKAALPQGTLITTAYHRLLESALESAGEYGLQTITLDSMLPFLEPNAPALFKLYGDIQQADLIVTEQDQNALIRGRVQDRQDMVDEVSRFFKRNSVLFLGVDLHDPVILALFDDVAGGKFQVPSFAVWTGMSEAEQQSLEGNRGVKVLEVDSVSLLQALGET